MTRELLFIYILKAELTHDCRELFDHVRLAMLRDRLKVVVEISSYLDYWLNERGFRNKRGLCDSNRRGSERKE